MTAVALKPWAKGSLSGTGKRGVAGLVGDAPKAGGVLAAHGMGPLLVPLLPRYATQNGQSHVISSSSVGSMLTWSESGVGTTKDPFGNLTLLLDPVKVCTTLAHLHLLWSTAVVVFKPDTSAHHADTSQLCTTPTMDRHWAFGD